LQIVENLPTFRACSGVLFFPDMPVFLFMISTNKPVFIVFLENAVKVVLFQENAREAKAGFTTPAPVKTLKQQITLPHKRKSWG
jgi:hypothetical protein